MGQGTPGGLNRQGLPGERKPDGNDKKEKKFEPAAPPARVGRKQRKQKGPEAAARLPTVTPLTKCKLRLLKLDRIKDYLLMEEEFVTNQERLKPQEEKAEEDRSKVDDLRGSPMSVGNLEELIDENHAIVSSSVGPEYYVGILSFVDKDQLEPGCAILMHNKVLSVVGLLQDEVDPMVSVMKVEKAPLESYADIGGLDAQIQEIKEAVELPLTHPELYEDIGIRPPKGVILYGEPGTGKTLLGSQVQFISITQCEYPRSPALGLGVIAAVALMLAQIIINVSTGCICCKRSPQPSNSNWTVALFCFVVSWFTFVIAFLLLLTGATLNDRHGVESMYFGNYYCYVVKPGVFAGGAVLSLASVVLGIVYYVTLNSVKDGNSPWGTSAPPNPGAIAMGQPQFPPPSTTQEPVFVHEDTYMRRQFT